MVRICTSEVSKKHVSAIYLLVYKKDKIKNYLFEINI